MVEVLDNAFQLAVLIVCLAVSLVHFSRGHGDEWLMASGFFGCNLLGLTYWIAYLMVFGETPRYFYVPDVAWAASYVFLLMLVAALDERRQPCAPVPMAWVAAAAMVPHFALYVTHGDVLLNVVECSIMAAIGYFAVRGIASAPVEGPEGDRRLHAAILIWWMAQLAVWTTSCFWGAVSFTPYIASDLLVSVSLLALLLEMRRALP